MGSNYRDVTVLNYWNIPCVNSIIYQLYNYPPYCHHTTLEPIGKANLSWEERALFQRGYPIDFKPCIWHNCYNSILDSYLGTHKPMTSSSQISKAPLLNQLFVCQPIKLITCKYNIDIHWNCYLKNRHWTNKVIKRSIAKARSNRVK